MTQAMLAARLTELGCPVTQEAVSRWEKDVHEPSLRVRPFLIDALRTSRTALFGSEVAA